LYFCTVDTKFGDVKIHYEAPPSQELPELLNNFFIWYKNFNQLNVGKVGQAMILSALSHLYFETLHPFEDGNGRIGRAIAEKVLAEQLEIPIYISLSKIIEANKKKYYSELKKAQRNVDVTDWILYFFDVLIKAQKDSKSLVLFTLKKVIFFDTLKEQLNERQLKAINKMLEHGENGFKGGMTAKKYGSINKISKATATRDLQHLLEIGAFVKIGAGRSIHYDINI